MEISWHKKLTKIIASVVQVPKINLHYEIATIELEIDKISGLAME